MGEENGSSVHDVPIVGHFTYAFTKGFGGALNLGDKSDEELEAEFKRLDTDNSGTLDKTELSEAFKALGKDQREICDLLDGMTEDELNLEQFKELVKGKAEKYFNDSGLPNLSKIHDIPILGSFTKAGAGLVSNVSWSVASLAFSAAYADMTDDQLKEKFDAIDTDKSGCLDAKEIGQALRDLGMKERDVRALMEKVGKDELDFAAFKKLV